MAQSRRIVANRRWRIPLQEHSGIHALHQQASATLGNATLREMLQVPWGVEKHNWVAAQTIALFDELVNFVTVLRDTCTPERCPRMCCGKQVLYEWADETTPAPRSLPAIEYMETLVEYAHKKLSDPSIVPQGGEPISDNFMPCIKMLHKRFFRVYAHAYTHHFVDIQNTGSEAELNYSFKHWLFFVRLYDLVSSEELEPMKRLIEKFERAQDEAEANRGGRQQPMVPRINGSDLPNPHA
mmetsp:Transcript_113226/g.283506  ORF Transcript_113226/g.283506 Transcript_113226/m.283506 type:complete len:240 (-) Transcript_113226:119-838(-)|eukprot:CAMPEP_0115254160 /NCGR_PEP_ID=MMETSP0270-20121206/45045_1 /TAXON_ID=71861 /ORGANISM="Scrippsiella trochoidea, Strain CCMP3099" /LENGTH=239 /DNA_ID=CAMNT_0002669689 /DNA_START=47 /DNA_END=766 /DNA_ORIENTATION=-